VTPAFVAEFISSGFVGTPEESRAAFRGIYMTCHIFPYVSLVNLIFHMNPQQERYGNNCNFTSP